MRNRKLFSLFTFLLLAGITSLRAEAVAKMPAPTGYVDDYAGVLSDSTKSNMADLCKELHEKTKAQIFVVTVHTLEGASVEEFANQLFHNWKIGEKKTDRGILLLFAIKEHKYRYEIGYGFEGILNDAKVGDFGRAMVPDLRAGNYDDAATTGLRSVAQVVADDAKVQLDSLADTSANATQEGLVEASPPVSEEQLAAEHKQDTQHSFLFFGGFVAVWGSLFLGIMYYIKRKGGTASSGSSSPGFTGWSSSSSSSDDSSSSSDDSFSGGDGGDSGGGGASGDW